MHLCTDYRDGNIVTYLKRYIYRLIQLPKEEYFNLTVYLRRHRFDTSNFDASVAPA
jgi:hypothetical protein